MNPKCIKCQSETTEFIYEFGTLYYCQSTNCYKVRSPEWRDVISPTIFDKKAKDYLMEISKSEEWFFEEIKNQKGYYVRAQPEPQRIRIDEKELLKASDEESG